jgi:hypothetical protein
MAYKWNPFTGTLDFNDSITADNSTYLVIQRIASESIIRTDVVAYNNMGEIKLANNNTTVDDAFVVGMALNNGNIGDLIDVLVMGIINDPIFNVFPLNSTIFLDTIGATTDVKPVPPSASSTTVVGRSYGNGEVFINPLRPVFI